MQMLARLVEAELQRTARDRELMQVEFKAFHEKNDVQINNQSIKIVNSNVLPCTSWWP